MIKKSLLIIAVITSFIHNGFSQWLQMSQPPVATINDIIYADSTLFVAVYGSGIVGSSNNGATWTNDTVGIPDLYVNCIVNQSDTIYAGTYYQGIFRSVNRGQSWTKIDSTLPITCWSVNTIAVKGKRIYAGTNGGMALSVNNGKTWVEADSGLSQLTISSLVESAGVLYAGMNGGGIYTYSDSLNYWTVSDSNLYSVDANVTCLTSTGDTVYAGTSDNGVWMSIGYPPIWHAMNNGLANPYIYSLEVAGSTLLAGTAGGGVYISNNAGASWSQTTNGINDSTITALAINGTTYYAGSDSGYVYSYGLMSGIRNLRQNSLAISAYPNPSTNATTIHITIQQKTHAQLSIYNSLGELQQVIANTDVTPGNYSFQTNLPTQGVYFVVLNTDAETSSMRILKQ